MHLISSILGRFVKLIYDGLAAVMPQEPAQVSYFALSIIIATIIIKLFIMFAILRVFFFPNFLKENTIKGNEANFIEKELIKRQ